VVAIGCVSAQRPWKNFIPYATSKAALVHTMKGLALALAPEVRVNVVSPGTVLPPVHYSEEMLARLREKIPLGRIGSAEDVARAVLFFAENDFVTGQVLAVDGGHALV
jgi:pteridine reductase